MPDFYPENNEPRQADPPARSLHKIVDLLGSGVGGSGGGDGGLAPSQYDTVTLSPENDPTVISFALNGSPVGTIYVTRSGNDVTYSTIPPEE
jgi:hypothetical protein